MLTTDGANVLLPIKPETTTDAMARSALATKLGFPLMDVPYVKFGDLDIEVDYQITNLDSMPGTAMVELNGANEQLRYDPSLIKLDPGNNEAPPTPGLSGDIPLDVPANGTIEGTFREDQLQEATIDLDQITRGNVNPFRATLVVNKNDTQFSRYTTAMFAPSNPVCQNNPDDTRCQPTPVPPAIPRQIFRGIVEVDLVFKPDRPMTMTYSVRVRDHRGIMNPKGLSDAAGNYKFPNITNYTITFAP